VSAELKDGVVRHVEITSEQGRPCTIQNPWPGRRVTVTRGDGKTETASGPRFVLKTQVDERLRLAPVGLPDEPASASRTDV